MADDDACPVSSPHVARTFTPCIGSECSRGKNVTVCEDDLPKVGGVKFFKNHCLLSIQNTGWLSNFSSFWNLSSLFQLDHHNLDHHLWGESIRLTTVGWGGQSSIDLPLSFRKSCSFSSKKNLDTWHVGSRLSSSSGGGGSDLPAVCRSNATSQWSMRVWYDLWPIEATGPMIRGQLAPERPRKDYLIRHQWWRRPTHSCIECMNGHCLRVGGKCQRVNDSLDRP